MIRYINDDLIVGFYKMLRLASGYNIAIVHCISNDWKLGAGIAKKIDEQFEVKKNFNYNEIKTSVGDSVAVKGKHATVINLITKELYYHKPTYKTLRASLESLAKNEEYKEHILLMPMIGCGLDKLSWDKVSIIIDEVLKDRKIAVFCLKPEKPYGIMVGN